MALQDFSKNYLKCSNGTLILTFFLPPFSVLSAIFVLYLNEALLLSLAGKSAMAPLSPKMVHIYSNAINFQMI